MKTYNPKTITLTMNGERVELHSMGEALRTSQPCPQVTCDGLDPWWKRRSVKPLSVTLLAEQAKIDELMERLRSLPPAPTPPDACTCNPLGCVDEDRVWVCYWTGFCDAGWFSCV